MTLSDIRSTNYSSYPLLLAYLLLMLSLLNADMGTVGRPFLAASSRNNAGASSATASKASFESHRQLYGSTVSIFEQSAVRSSPAIVTEAQNEKARRMAALALVVYAIGDGIRRQR
jgi:hypothetical protein